MEDTMSARSKAARNSLICGLLALIAFIGIGLAASAQEASTAPAAGSAEIDYPGFLALSEDVFALRETRLVSLADFTRMKGEPGTLILDTRSRQAFEMGHVDGAVNLPFSDFTDAKLAEVIPSKDTRILIYCNNNFSDNIAPVMLKRVELALNIPTFINLYGYGYEDIYELGELTQISHPDVGWVRGIDLQEN
ncbi:MAG: rhodanese-like domain-containing protein [Alphaproteobacteria bacterium]|nr:rhodanese-like domain-containing protein [Alphaproteobacteria bacterium]